MILGRDFFTAAKRATRMPFEPAGEVELEQDHEDLRRMQPRVADDLVDADRGRAERLDDAVALVVAGRRRRRKVRRFLELLVFRRLDAGARRDLLDDVARLGDQDGAVLEQLVGAGRARVERRAGNREDQPSHLAGEPGTDQRARAVCRLDDDQPERQAGDQAVAARKIPGARLPSERHFRDHGAAALGDFRGKVDILGRIGAVEPAGQHGDGSGCQAALMRRRVDAAGQAGDDGIVFAAELGGEAAREFDAGERGVARADDGDRRQGEDIRLALDGDDRRRLLHAPQHRRIVGLADRHQPRAEFFGRRELGLGFALGRDARQSRSAARTHQLRQHCKRCFRRAEAVDQVAKTCRADILGADQAKPMDALAVAEPWLRAGRGLAHSLAPMRDSEPAISREMLARCL